MLKSINPANGETVSEYEEDSDASIEQAIAGAFACYRTWSRTDYAKRTQLLAKIGDLFEAKAEEGGRIISEEMGKTYYSATGEVKKCASAFRYYADKGPELLKAMNFPLGSGGTATAEWHPLGVVLAVMPWNFPMWQAVRALAPAIMAGNAMLLKHASNVQGSAKWMEKIVAEAGAPKGLFTNLTIGSKKVEQVLSDDRVAAATLTGSEGAGSAVAATAGKHLKKVVLELGGSDPFIVMPSADLDEAAKVAATARTQNSGQSCICAKRMIVHSDVYDSFTAKFTAAMADVTVGDPFDDATDIGPLSSFEQRDTVLEQIAEAKKQGAELLFGGEQPGGDLSNGAYLTPGIIAGLDPDCDAAKDEIFGPIALLFKANDIDDAIAIANATRFGLGGAVFTKDGEEEARFTAEVETGMIAGAVASLPDKELWQKALADEDSLAAAAFDRFCLSLGSVAGDYALAHGAKAVVIAGGLGYRIRKQLQGAGGFDSRFVAKGRFQHLMETIPVKLITHEQPGLYGAAAAFAQEYQQ